MKSSSELQLKLVLMMKWFHEFCVEQNLTYYVLGGTMLGTVRHNGFIPWDDDLDVGMPREDYKKLAQLLANQKNMQYVLETPEMNEKDYYYPFSKIYDTNTTLVENTKCKIKRGIYIDIFPLDGVGNSFEEGKKRCNTLFKLCDLLLLKVTGIRKGRSIYKNLGVLLFRFIPIDAKKILKKLVLKCQELDYDECDWVANIGGVWRIKELMPKEYFGKPTLYKFENIEVYGVEKPNDYLTALYGDWRKLPPVEKRVTHHDYILCDLNKPYSK